MTLLTTKRLSSTPTKNNRSGRSCVFTTRPFLQGLVLRLVVYNHSSAAQNHLFPALVHAQALEYLVVVRYLELVTGDAGFTRAREVGLNVTPYNHGLPIRLTAMQTNQRRHQVKYWYSRLSGSPQRHTENAVNQRVSMCTVGCSTTRRHRCVALTKARLTHSNSVPVSSPSTRVLFAYCCTQKTSTSHKRHRCCARLT